jgi:tetratricopeptide (TPR) repeat protein
MKNKIYLILTITAVLLSSCNDDFLYKKNLNKVASGTYYRTVADATSAINSCYSALQRRSNSQWSAHIYAVRAGESVFTSFVTGAPEFIGLDDYTISSSAASVEMIWSDNYKGVMYCNTALERIPDIEMDQNLKNRLMGEAYFMRGIYHFQLMSYFGEAIPINDGAPKELDQLYPSPAGPGVGYDLVISDFTKAKELLPIVDTYRKTADLGRATKGAATAYLGKALLFKKRYAEAALQFKEVIDQKCGTYALVQNFRDNHDERNENNVESLFEVQYEYMAAGTFWAIDGSGGNETNFIEREATQVRARPEEQWWNSRPSDAIAAEFEKGDPRFYQSFWTPGGDKFNYLELKDGKFTDNWQTYEEHTPDAFKGWNFWRKWCRDYSGVITNFESPINLRLMRYADVLLMYAECMIEDASIGGSPATYINMVRDRARADNNTDAFPNGGNIPTVEELIAAAPTFNGIKIDNMRAALRHERMVELAFEFKRWDDIVRWDIGAQVLPAGYKYVLPIAQGELNTNPNMKGNAAN